MAIVQVQDEGRIIVPEPVRRAMGIETGTELVCIHTEPSTFECHVLPALVGLRVFLDAHTLHDQGMTQEEIDAAIEEGMMADADAEYGDLLDRAGTNVTRGADGNL